MKKNSSKSDKKNSAVKRTSSKKKQNKEAEKLSSDSEDIGVLILRDHEPIKELILILKDPDVSIAKKFPAFVEFERLLSCHAKAEEESLYVYLKGEDDYRIEGLEGDTEHVLAAQLMREVNKGLGNDDIWMAKVKVLAEIVNHHVKEEEKEVLKEVRKEFSKDKRKEIGEIYSRLLHKYQGEKREQKKLARSSDVEDDVSSYMKH